ncbi:MAG: oligoendopeptidase F, partial [candidate division Zixibacteria bacterium]|nr:oligoendopeptidase F [candidate division Zixibacteria bacterium]
MGFILKHQTLTNILLAASLVLLVVGSIAARPNTLNRDSIPDEYKWDLSDLYTDWAGWEAGLAELDALMTEYPKLQGTLAQGAEQVLKAYKMNDDLNVLAYRVYRYPDLMHYSDTRDNDINARLQQVQILFARFGPTIAWFNPELLAIPWETMKTWLDDTPDLAPYRYSIEDLYRQQEHVLDADKEQLLSYYSLLTGAPY